MKAAKILVILAIVLLPTFGAHAETINQENSTIVYEEGPRW